jgi:hypothetical protein
MSNLLDNDLPFADDKQDSVTDAFARSVQHLSQFNREKLGFSGDRVLLWIFCQCVQTLNESIELCGGDSRILFGVPVGCRFQLFPGRFSQNDFERH